MASINPQFFQRKRKYIFPIIQEKLATLLKESPETKVLNLGIGDISLPLAPEIAKGIEESAREMTKKAIGYGPAEGYSSLRKAILDTDYSDFGFTDKEISISSGINEDLGLIQELFSVDSTVGIPDPVYPLYQELNLLAGRKKIVSFPCIEQNGFIPMPPDEPLNLVYLCSPGNPTGIAMTYKHLEKWVKWANDNKSVLFFDSAYKAFITSKDVPKTIYEIDGAKNVAIECASFSKSAGFTGLRLGYTILPKELLVSTPQGEKPFFECFHLFKDIKTNGIAYPIQIGGLYALSKKGKEETLVQIASYLYQAKRVKEKLLSLGFTCYGGIDSPYIWCKAPSGDSWEFFSLLLKELHIITVPGVGFGDFGEGFVRFSLFITKEACDELLERLENNFRKPLCITTSRVPN